MGYPARRIFKVVPRGRRPIGTEVPQETLRASGYTARAMPSGDQSLTGRKRWGHFPVFCAPKTTPYTRPSVDCGPRRDYGSPEDPLTAGIDDGSRGQPPLLDPCSLQSRSGSRGAQRERGPLARDADNAHGPRDAAVAGEGVSTSRGAGRAAEADLWRRFKRPDAVSDAVSDARPNARPNASTNNAPSDALAHARAHAPGHNSLHCQHPPRVSTRRRDLLLPGGEQALRRRKRVHHLAPVRYIRQRGPAALRRHHVGPLIHTHTFSNVKADVRALVLSFLRPNPGPDAETDNLGTDDLFPDGLAHAGSNARADAQALAGSNAISDATADATADD